jgi:hypothetical protein
MYTLFFDISIVIDQFKRTFNVPVSEQFVRCADTQLTELFTRISGLRAGKNLSFSITTDDNDLHYIKDNVSKIDLKLYVNHNWNPIKITWKSKSGRIYNYDDTDIDCADIEFSFEGLDIALYQKQMYPKDPLPFKLKGLSYELVVERLNVNSTINMELRKDAAIDTDSVIRQIADFINDYNTKSEKKDRKYGVVHNAKFSFENGQIKCDIDFGSAGVSFLKKLLQAISEMNHFAKVVIE